MLGVQMSSAEQSPLGLLCVCWPYIIQAVDAVNFTWLPLRPTRNLLPRAACSVQAIAVLSSTLRIVPCPVR